MKKLLIAIIAITFTSFSYATNQDAEPDTSDIPTTAEATTPTKSNQPRLIVVKSANSGSTTKASNPHKATQPTSKSKTAKSTKAQKSTKKATSRTTKKPPRKSSASTKVKHQSKTKATPKKAKPVNKKTS